MSYLLNILISLLLLIVVYQDFRYRAISWITLPFLFTAFASDSILTYDFNSFLQSFFFNIGFIVLQLLAVTAYFSLKNQKITNITSHYIGWGDIFFFIVAAAVFSPVNFIVFYLLGILITLIFVTAFRFLKKNSFAEIPLAGAMALLLLIVYLYENFSNEINLHNDPIRMSFPISF